MDTADIIRQLEADPALRAQLRAVLLADEFLGLPGQVRGLTERVERLESAVERLEAAVERLAEAQARTDANLSVLVERVGRLELGQERLEERLERLERRHDDLRTEVGRLSAVVGGTVEEDAASLIETVLTGKGWVVTEAPHAVEVDGELDVLALAHDGEGRPVTVLAEAKVRLRPADVRRFAGSLPGLLRAAGISGDHLGYVYGLRVYSGSEAAARELGLGVLSYDGERVEPLLRTA